MYPPESVRTKYKKCTRFLHKYLRIYGACVQCSFLSVLIFNISSFTHKYAVKVYCTTIHNNRQIYDQKECNDECK